MIAYAGKGENEKPLPRIGQYNATMPPAMLDRGLGL